MRSFDLGNALVFKTVIAESVGGEAAQPTNVTLIFVGPDGLASQISPSNTGPGAFEATFNPPVPGVWQYQWRGTGAVTVASEGLFEVRPSAFN